MEAANLPQYQPQPGIPQYGAPQPQYGAPQLMQRPSYVAGAPMPAGHYMAPGHPQPAPGMYAVPQARVLHGAYGVPPGGHPGQPLMMAPGAATTGVLPGAQPVYHPAAAAQPVDYAYMGQAPAPAAEEAPQAYAAAIAGAQDEAQFGEVQEEPIKVSMTVPPGAGPGTKLQYAAPDGQELRLTVPEGVPPGSVMTLTQDPVTKQWRCMAEPADDGAPEAPPPQQPEYQAPQQQQQQQLYGAPQQQQLYQQQQQQPGGPSTVSERVTTYVTGQPPMVTTYSSAGGAPTVRTIPSQLMGGAHPMPVNLSYVPPPVGHPGAVGMPPPQQVLVPAPGGMPINPQAAAAFNPPRQDPGFPGGMVENRPSYTPPPVAMMENRPSYTPQVVMPHMVPAGMTLPNGQVTIDPNRFGTQQMVPGDPRMHQPVYQSPSYVPPPLVHNSPSYVPPPGAGTMPVMGGGHFPGGPSISSLPPQVGMPPQVFQHHVAPGAPMHSFPQLAPGIQPMGFPPQPGMPQFGQPGGAPVMQFGQPMGQPMGGQPFGGFMQPGMHPQPCLQQVGMHQLPHGMQPGMPQPMQGHPGQPMPFQMPGGMPPHPGHFGQQPFPGQQQPAMEAPAGMYGAPMAQQQQPQHEEL